jgi:hypothetical protein
MSGCCPAVAGRKRVTRLELATSSLGDAFAEVIKVSRKPEESVLLRSQLRAFSALTSGATIAGTWNDSALVTVKAASDIGAESLPLQTMIPAIGTKTAGIQTTGL